MPTKPSGSTKVSTGRSLSFEEFVEVAVAAAARATEKAKLPGGHYPIWVGIIIRPPDLNPQLFGGQTKST
ncbi:MAG: hypothetical protein AABO58_01460 [Acidobacteriota bacterium]